MEKFSPYGIIERNFSEFIYIPIVAVRAKIAQYDHSVLVIRETNAVNL